MSKLLLTMFTVAGLALSGTASLGCAATQSRESTGGYIDDSTITTKVKAAIFGEESLRSADVSVETFKGTVQLSGFVDSAQHARRAEEVTLAVHGVERVNNNLIVK
jgi:osmotically-inducible protein OsmY